MSVIDAELLLSDAQAVTASAASTNIYDASAARNLGVGKPIYAVARVATAFTDAGSDSTVTVKLEADDDSAFGSVDATQTLGTFAALSAVGTRLIAAIQPDILNKRYFRGYYTLANGNLSTGAIDLAITLDPDLWAAYPDNVTIN